MTTRKHPFFANSFNNARPIAITSLALFSSIFAFHGENPVGLWVLFGLAALIIFDAIYSGAYRKLFYLLLNPLLALPFYYSTTALIKYGLGQSELIQCTYFVERDATGQEIPIVDPEFIIPIEFWDDDCDWKNLYSVTADVNNWVTKELLSPRQK